MPERRYLIAASARTVAQKLEFRLQTFLLDTLLPSEMGDDLAWEISDLLCAQLRSRVELWEQTQQDELGDGVDYRQSCLTDDERNSGRVGYD